MKEQAEMDFLSVKEMVDKQQVPTSDSLLQKPLLYYRHTEQEEKLAEIYYLQGVIYQQQHLFIRAADCFQQAAAMSQDNQRLLLKSELALTDIYLSEFYQEDTIPVLKKAEGLAIQLADSSFLAEVAYRKALLQIKRNKSREALSCLWKALEYTADNRIVGLCYKTAGEVYLQVQQPDSALLFTNLALSKQKDSGLSLSSLYLQKAEVMQAFSQKDSVIFYLEECWEKLSLSQQLKAYRLILQIQKKSRDQTAYIGSLEKYIQLKDLLDQSRKEDLVEKLQSLHDYKLQREQVNLAEKKLAQNKIELYRFAVVALLFFCLLLYVLYRSLQKKRKMYELLQQEIIAKMQLEARQKAMEYSLLQEQEKNRKQEVRMLTQKVDYYKQLNAITIPMLMLQKNTQGAIHLQKSDWNMIIQNTDACFDQFTVRLRRFCPLLTADEIRFCCLVKMELSIAVLAEIYHIAKGSISRKKMRLKEKMNIQGKTLDEFIIGF